MPPIPAISAHPMPARHQLPANTVHWQPDPARAVLLVHDMQRHFLRPFPVHRPPLTELIAHIRALRARSDRLGVPVVYTAQPGGVPPAERGLLTAFWGPGMPAAGDHCAIVPQLAPRAADLLISKHRYSAFHRTPLLDRLHELGRDQLLLCGVYTHIGILHTALDALAEDVHPFLIADATADFTPELHLGALRLAAGCCAMVVTTAQAECLLRDPSG